MLAAHRKRSHYFVSLPLLSPRQRALFAPGWKTPRWLEHTANWQFRGGQLKSDPVMHSSFAGGPERTISAARASCRGGPGSSLHEALSACEDASFILGGLAREHAHRARNHRSYW